MSDAISTIAAFVAGDLSTKTFEQAVYHDPALEALLMGIPAPKCSHAGDTLYYYLIALDYDDPGDILNAHTVLTSLLEARGVKIKASKRPHDTFDLILSAQPRWLNADAKYIATVLSEAPPLPRAELKLWLKKRILELFRCRGGPPRWMQSPAWPMGASGPMVFLGQLAVPDYFHDDAAVYVFHDPATGECASIIQVA